jgi:ABC-2 type transport system permease protein
VNWQQLRAIIWLRWRLSRNQFIRGGQLNAVLSVLMLAVGMLVSASLAAGAVTLGWFLGKQGAAAQVLLMVWDAAMFVFLVFWFSGLMVEIQRSESVDLEKLLRLPITLQQVFVFNYAASHFTPSIIVLVPALVGLCLGLALSGGATLALIAPVVLCFIFAITAWTYCLRGWMAALMVNKRRRRAILLWFTIAFVLIAQTPNLFFHSSYFRSRTQPKPTANQKRGGPARNGGSGSFLISEPVLAAHLVLPPGWPGYSAMSLKEHNPFPALATAAASFLLGVLGLMRAYRMTLRFYLGAETVSGTIPPHPSPLPRERENSRPAAGPQRALLVERRLPWIRDDIAGLALATLRSLLRAPELKMALIMPIVMGAVMMSMYFRRPNGAMPESITGLVAAGAVAAAVFCLVPTMSNVFGLDRNGFRALILLPTERRHILFAKNLAFLPFLGGVTLALLLMVKLVVGLPWGNLLAGLLQAPAAFLLFSLLTNLVSILAPYRLAQGTLNAKKPKAIVFLAVFGSFFALPFVLLPIMIPPAFQLLATGLEWPGWIPVNLLATTAVLAGTLWLYTGLLPIQGRLLQRREQTILREVTEEIE